MPPVASQIPGKFLCFLVMLRMKAECGPGKPSLVLDEIERLPCGRGSEGILASSVRSEPRTTASMVAVCTDTRSLF